MDTCQVETAQSRLAAPHLTDPEVRAALPTLRQRLVVAEEERVARRKAREVEAVLMQVRRDRGLPSISAS